VKGLSKDHVYKDQVMGQVDGGNERNLKSIVKLRPSNRTKTIKEKFVTKWGRCLVRKNKAGKRGRRACPDLE